NLGWLMNGEEIPRNSGIASGSPKGAQFDSPSLQLGREVHSLIENGNYGRFKPAIEEGMEREVPAIFFGRHNGKNIIFSARADLVRVCDLIQDIKTGEFDNTKSYFWQNLGYSIVFGCKNADIIGIERDKGEEVLVQKRFHEILKSTSSYFERYFEYLIKCDEVKDLKPKEELTIGRIKDERLKTLIEKVLKTQLFLKNFRIDGGASKEEKDEVKAFLKGLVVRDFDEMGNETLYGSVSNSNALLVKGLLSFEDKDKFLKEISEKLNNQGEGEGK
ncbi:MAG: hypothetical protein ACRCYP_01380, partial [Alphaproteobacteria bacterium]